MGVSASSISARNRLALTTTPRIKVLRKRKNKKRVGTLFHLSDADTS
jgi:hypothetical protein